MGDTDYAGEVVVKHLPGRQGHYLHEVEHKKRLEDAFKTANGSAPPGLREILRQNGGAASSSGISATQRPSSKEEPYLRNADVPDMRRTRQAHAHLAGNAAPYKPPSSGPAVTPSCTGPSGGRAFSWFSFFRYGGVFRDRRGRRFPPPRQVRADAAGA